jgi:hypothetical protein
MRSLILAAVAAAALMTSSVAASAYVYRCAYVWVDGIVYFVCA